MARALEPSSTSDLSNGSSGDTAVPEAGTSLGRLSSNLERLLFGSEIGYADAEIVADGGGAAVGVHRCILAARSGYFRDLFSRGGAAAGALPEGGKPRYLMSELVPRGRVGVEALMDFLGYVYTGKLRRSSAEASACVDAGCTHDACGPAIGFVVEMMYVSSAFKIPELVSVFQRRLLNFVEKAFVEDVIPILLVASHSQLNQLLNHCIQRIAKSDLHTITLDKELPQNIVGEIKSIRKKSQPNELDTRSQDPLHEKRIRRIIGALDSDDVELLKLLLSESEEITLDNANAIHYAAAYCDSKVVAEILEFGLADVNLKNARGYTPLHIAAMRREPSVIMSLLMKGASVLEITANGQSTISICRRLTRAKDYYAKTEQGHESNKDRLCIDILEREMMRNPVVGEDSVMSPLLADDLHTKLLYLEDRVAFARLFFPSEAKLAMEIAHADTTSEFAGLTPSRSSGNLREVDLNETPSMRNKRLRSRVDALMRTVELGRRYFPNCSEILDKFLEDDQPDLLYLEKGTPDERKIKRMRFYELKEDVCKAFTKDKAECRLREKIKFKN